MDEDEEIPPEQAVDDEAWMVILRAMMGVEDEPDGPDEP